MDSVCVEALVTQAKAKITVLIVGFEHGLAESLVQDIQVLLPARVVLLSTGEDALLVSRAITPDLLLFDYDLPGINGLKLYEHFSSVERLRRIPALMIETDESSAARSYPGLVRLKKPFDPIVLLTLLRGLLPAAAKGPVQRRVYSRADTESPEGEMFVW